MYKKILVPIDLSHLDQLGKATQTASDIAEKYGIPVRYVGVTATTPSSVARTPEEYTKKLEAYAAAQAEKHGQPVEARAFVSHDPSTDLDATLMKAISESGADLVVMASHTPGLPEHLFASNAGYLASHSDVSVLVVRP